MNRFSTSLLFIAFLFIVAPANLFGQCSTSNATGCLCEDGSNDCDLLPDMTISWYGIENYLSGPNQQNNRVYVTGSTPNIGHGAFTVRGVDMDGYRWFVCGTDTFSVNDPSGSQTFSCPNGGTAKQLTFQRIYHKNGSQMTSYTRLMPQGMTYHPNHGHTHYDQWGLYSLRLPEVGVSDPRQWPIINSGFKLGFCLMDYNSCSDAAVLHHCKDDNTVYGQGTTLTAANFPNYGLGGGNYGCSMVEQGISSGYTDIYSEYLDGMWIDVPQEVCNGDYWIVYEVDPFDIVLEENEDNNYTAVPITLTQQTSGSATARILADGSSFICEGDSVLLRANAGISYSWSNGKISNAIWAKAGSYTVAVTTYCGIATSTPFVVTELAQPNAPSAMGDSICQGEQAALSASGQDLVWYDAQGEILATGNAFNTPPLFSSTSFFVSDENVHTGTISFGGRANNTGSGEYHAGGQGLLFDVHEQMNLRSVKVYAGSAGIRTVELYNSVGALINYRTMLVPFGESRIDLNMVIEPGTGWHLSISGQCDLYRNINNMNYPYQISDVATITSSTSGNNYYYYFYDWEVEIGSGSCLSPLVEVPVVVNNCTGITEPEVLRSLSVYPNPTGNEDVTIEMHLISAANVELNVYDQLGRQLSLYQWPNLAGNPKRTVDTKDLKPGVYQLKFQVGQRLYYRKLVVK
ncbi:MAG: T9SS type A sorting domain-containing protein [Flavobacteriales bacterium]|nr:T9SS type A sorting domain-containing protein [Flavobacteriales bacterium]